MYNPPGIIYFWPDSGDEDAQCGLWWPEPTLEDAPEAGPGRPALVVPSGMTEDEALQALWPGYDRVEWAKMRTTVVYACRDFPDAVAVLLKTAIERRARKEAPDG